MRAKLYRGWWYAVWRESGATRRATLSTQDKDTALRRLADFERSRKQSPVTAGEIAEAYFADKTDRRTHGRMKDAWKALKPHFGHLRPDQITRDVCRTYAKKRKLRGRKAGTIIKELTILRAALRWDNKNTPAVIELPDAPPPKDRALTRVEFAKLVDSAAMFHVKLFIVLALTTAGRKEAILGLTWDRVSFENGKINLGRGVRQKGRAVVAMNDTARQWLVKAKEAATTDYVVEWAGGEVKNIRKGFERACERAGLKDVTPHVMRHTAAVWMAEAGVPMPEIAAYLGHTDSRTTERVYARFSPEHLKKAAAVLDSAPLAK